MLQRALQIVSGLLIGLAFVAAIVWLTPLPGGPVEWEGGAPPPSPYPAPPLELSDLEGNLVNLASFRGKTTVVFFGYSNCPDVCPATLLNLTRALDELGPRRADRVQVVFVTLDPERDTPERLRSWMSNFHPSIVTLTGAQASVWEQAAAWGVYASIAPTRDADEGGQAHDHGAPGALPDGLAELIPQGAPGAYAVEHSTRSFVLDRSGQIVLLLAPFQPGDAMARDLRRVIR